jgi:DNA repair photolyase
MRKIIYTPTGRAGEYGKYAVNLFEGCSHGCTYCYAAGMFCKAKDRPRKDFHASPTPKIDALARLERDLHKLHGESVFMSFSCDPFPPEYELREITLQAIGKILHYGNAVNILTKGGMRARECFSTLTSTPFMKPLQNKLGATLTFVTPSLSAKYEPFATLPDSRIEMLKTAHDMGIYTWASIEPVLIPSESLEIMRIAIPYVDEFKIGKLNHHPEAEKAIDWKKFAKEAVRLMEYSNKKYILKADLKKYYE